ncbi:cytosolic carboxypeptidase 3 isoform X11 [Monodelphis domestica]|uniref:cytosolic carboxypeptidase 3 isoform X11 n=1 Tax=Monodelphis domestica TaxID=13616 RepID=UPI0024E2228A|nr:cytosolic carboxypeptidase 3 isoform X11 [Monodelphis domestica]
MSEESDKDEQLTDRTTSDEDELDDDSLMKFVSEDLHRCALFTDTTSDQYLPRTTQILLEYQLGRWVPRLREPRDLYGVSSSGPLSQTRWPCHCEVVQDKILHIDWAPPFLEPLYVSAGDELAPHYPDSSQGSVVYLGDEAYKDRCFMYSRIGGIRSLQKASEILPLEDWENTLIFEARLMEDREILLYCDLHGHSRRGNIFMYGCEDSDEDKEMCLEQRIFPFMLSKNCPNKFSFSSCKFDVRKSKEGTGRVVIWKMGVQNSFTMEATFCGSTLGDRRGTHFNTKDLESMGYHFCDSLLDYCDPDQTKYYQCMRELEEMDKQQSGTANLEKPINDSEVSSIDAILDPDSSDESDASESNEIPPFLRETTQIKTKENNVKTTPERHFRPYLKNPRGAQENKVRESEIIPLNQESERNNAKNHRMNILELTGKQMTLFSHFGEEPLFQKLQNQKVESRGNIQQSPKETNPQAKGAVQDDFTFDYFKCCFPEEVKIPDIPPWIFYRYFRSLGKLLLRKIGERGKMEMTALKSKGCRLFLAPSIALLHTAVFSLLLYALLWKSGNLIDLPTKKIGFYNFCLWNESSNSLLCHQFPELEKLGVSQSGLALARLGVYGALVLILFASLSLLLVHCPGNEDKWKLVVVLLGASAILLLLGLLLFLSYICRWIQPSELGAEFLALVGAEVMLLLLLLTVIRHAFDDLGERQAFKAPGSFPRISEDEEI